MTFEADLTIIFRSGAILYRTVRGDADGEQGFVADVIASVRASEAPVQSGVPGGGGFQAADVVGIDVRNVRDPAKARFPRAKKAGTKSGTVKRTKAKKAK
jgi:hypothetical protein